jgi:iron(III) transport system permease protein
LLFLLLFLALPLAALLLKSLQNPEGLWVGLDNFVGFWRSPTAGRAALNSLTVAAIATPITLLLAFALAFGVTRTAMKGKALFRVAARIPLLAPSLLPALSLLYLFGNQGLLRGWLMGHSIYGPIGIVMGELFYCFPHAAMILITALSVADARLYEAAEALGAGPWRRFLTITLPGAVYGLINAAFVTFTLVITDFGIPKVLGGQYPVLATDIYQQVVGLQNFGMGAVVGMALLTPAVIAFFAEKWGAKRQKALLSSRSVPYRPRPAPIADWAMLGLCGLILLWLLAILAMAGFASLVKFWPYNLHLTLSNYDFERFDEAGWSSFFHSLQMAGWTAAAGSSFIFLGAYLLEKLPGMGLLKAPIRLLAVTPLAVPGLVLGLSYIFFFNHPLNPLNGLYGGMAILVLSSCVHYYPVAHLTAVTALKQLDPEFEAVSASLKVDLGRTFWRVTLPLCLPALLDIALYLFVNGMTTVSAVVFLYTPDTKPASVAILNMDDSGAVAGAAAMAMMIVLSSAFVKAVHSGASRFLLSRTQRWREAR